ncbi:hypothetical protein FDECE_3629 [Fusarium decemcellulare]|nr:hypothetical protein FDECE_3629 [Fusarium decemcellulare]
MSYYFQPPIFGHYLVGVAPAIILPTQVTTVAYYSSPLYWQIAPATIPLPRTVVLPTISIKVIFHRAGTILASNDVYYDSPPSRNTVLANLSYWSQGHGLGDRVYSGQATLYLTSSFLSTLTILPGTGPVRPAHAVRTMPLAEQTSVWEFEAIMAQIPTRGLGAFLVVDMQGPRNNQNLPLESNPPDDPQSPPSPDPPEDSANTDDTSPPAPEAESDNGQTPPEQNHSETEPKGEDNDENIVISSLPQLLLPPLPLLAVLPSSPTSLINIIPLLTTLIHPLIRDKTSPKAVVMDLCITAEEPFAFEPLRSKPFSPVLPAPAAADSPRGRQTQTPGPFSSAASLIPLPAAAPVTDIEFGLFIHDSSNDSSLTHPWEVPDEPLRIHVNTTKGQLLNQLRARLPIPVPASTKNNGKGNPGVAPRRGRAIRRQKLVEVTMYWTFRGMILPLGPNDEEWHYRNPITKTDLITRTELEWFLLKEMMVSSSGSLKCYIAIRGENPPAKKTSAWWFGSST